MPSGPEYRIRILTTSDNAGLEQAKQAMDKTSKATEQAGEKLKDFAKANSEVARQSKVASEGIGDVAQKLGNRLAGTAAIAAVGVKAVNEALQIAKPSLAEASTEIDRTSALLAEAAKQGHVFATVNQAIADAFGTFNALLEAKLNPNLLEMAKNIGNNFDRLSDLKRIADDTTKSLENLIQAGHDAAGIFGRKGQGLDEQTKGAIERLDAEEQRQLALAGQEPVASVREQKQGDIRKQFAGLKQSATRQGRSARLGVIDEEITRQNAIIAEAQNAIPNRDELLGKVAAAQEAARTRQNAQVSNREAFAQQVLLEGVTKLGPSPTPLDIANTGAVDELTRQGIVSHHPIRGLQVDREKLNAALDAARSRIPETRSALDAAKAGEAAAFAQLPPGVGSIADVDTLIEQRTAAAKAVRKAGGERKFQLFQEQRGIFSSDEQSRHLFGITSQTADIQTSSAVNSALAGEFKELQQQLRETIHSLGSDTGGNGAGAAGAIIRGLDKSTNQLNEILQGVDALLQSLGNIKGQIRVKLQSQ